MPKPRQLCLARQTNNLEGVIQRPLFSSLSFSMLRQCEYKHCRRFLRRKKRGTTNPPKRFCSQACKIAAQCGSGSHHIRIRVNGERIYLHRYVMEQKLGRKLTDEEIVHHKDEDRFHNHDSNLEVIDKSTHLARHNYWRGHRQPKNYSSDDISFWLQESKERR